MLRDAVRSLLSLEADIDIVGAVGTGQDAIDAVERLHPVVAASS